MSFWRTVVPKPALPDREFSYPDDSSLRAYQHVANANSSFPVSYSRAAITAGVDFGWGERPLRAEERGQDPAWSAPQRRSRLPSNSFVVLGYNDLGMHCMNQDFSQLCILPPFNNLHAQVIDRRGEEPRIASSGVSVLYSIPGNTISTTKTNFWSYAPALFGVDLPPNIGLTGNGLSGVMVPTGANDWVVTGIPVTPFDDN